MKKLEALKTRLTIAIFSIAMGLTFFGVNAHADATFDENGFKTWVLGWLKPLLNVILVIIPVVTAIYCGYKAIKWLSDDAEGTQQKTYFATVKTALMVGVFSESIALILRFFGLNV